MKQFGLDFLGSGMYPKVVAQTMPEWAAFGAFDKEFGDCTPAANEAYKRGCRVFRIQLLWHGNHIYGDADIPAIKLGAEKWGKWKAAHNDATVLVSPFCEHQLKNPDKYLDIIKQNSYSCSSVNSPLKNGALSSKYINEFHAAEIKPRASKTPFLFSFDGTPVVDSDVETYKKNYAKAEIFFWWDARFNMHKESDEKARDCPPDKELIESILALNAPKGACNLIKGDLWKSHGEYNTDWRSEKPCYITHEKASSAQLKLNGKVIHTLKRYYGDKDHPGDMADGRARYYATKMGYQISNQVCEVWVNNKKRGTVNPGFRQNEYRI